MLDKLPVIQGAWILLWELWTFSIPLTQNGVCHPLVCLHSSYSVHPMYFEATAKWKIVISSNCFRVTEHQQSIHQKPRLKISAHKVYIYQTLSYLRRSIDHSSFTNRAILRIVAGSRDWAGYSFIITGDGLHNWGSFPGRDRDISSFHRIHYGVHPVS
jgi:hypothetical protein